MNSLGVYKCPADRATTKSPFGKGGGIPKVRSNSMSCFMNPLPGETRAMGKTYRNQGDFVLGPAMTWVTIDENPASINDGWFVHESQSSFVDFPASYHNSAGGLTFADGHSEIKKWRSPTIITYGQPKTSSNATLDKHRRHLAIPADNGLHFAMELAKRRPELSPLAYQRGQSRRPQKGLAFWARSLESANSECWLSGRRSTGRRAGGRQ